jgi:hypothetical protein
MLLRRLSFPKFRRFCASKINDLDTNIIRVNKRLEVLESDFDKKLETNKELTKRIGLLEGRLLNKKTSELELKLEFVGQLLILSGILFVIYLKF